MNIPKILRRLDTSGNKGELNMRPACLKLDDKQVAKLDAFIDLADRQEGSLIDIDELDCCMSSPVTFQIFSSGIGDCINVHYRGYQVSLSYGDEPELDPLPFLLAKEEKF